MATTKALLIPGDRPPTLASIKRQVLFFDSVLLMHPSDAAILNDREVSETFPHRRIAWGQIWPYPRSGDYDDEYRRISAQSERAQARGLLRFLSPTKALQPTDTWVAVAALTQKEALLRAAIPDFDRCTPPLYLRQGWYNLTIPSETGCESRYMWMQAVEMGALPDVGIEWTRTAIGRLGRTIKTIRRASFEGAVPLAIDASSQNVCLALGAQAYDTQPRPADLASLAIALDVVDPGALDAALCDMAWTEVLSIRKEILPSVAKLRGLLQASVRAARRPQNSDLHAYANALQALKSEYVKASNDLQEAWRRIGFRTVEAAATGLPSVGLLALAPSPTWAAALMGFGLGVLAKTIGGAPADIRAMVKASNALKASPLFAFHNLEAIAHAAAQIPPK